MKKLYSTIMMLAMMVAALSLTACGGDDDEDEINGSIDLFITQDDETWIRAPYNYNLHIDYNDRINTNKHDNQQLDEI